MHTDWREVVALKPRGRAEISAAFTEDSTDLLRTPEILRGTIQEVRITTNDVVEVELDGGRVVNFPNGFAPFTIENFRGEQRVTFANAQHDEFQGRPNTKFVPCHLYLR